MSSERLRSGRHVGATGLVWILALALTASLACGRKEDPKPPPRKNPAKTRDLKIWQRGTDLVLTMGYPSATAGGQALAGIDRVRFFQYSRPAPEFMEQELSAQSSLIGDEETAEPEVEAAVEDAGEVEVEAIESEGPESESPESESPESEDPEQESTEGDGDGEGEGEEEAEEDAEEPAEPNKYLNIMVDPEQFRKGAKEVLVLEGDALDQAVIGGRIVVSVPIEEITTEPPTAYTFQARTTAGPLESAGSNTASFVPLPPPSTPTGVEATPEPGGVRLRWEVVPEEDEILGYQIYRKAPLATLYGESIGGVPPDRLDYIDRSARFGAKYVYAVTAIGMRGALVESGLGGEVQVAFRDDFAPAPPRGLVVLAEVGSTRVVWEIGREADIAGYIVSVSRDGGEPVELTPEPIAVNEFVHTGTESGVSYAYTVVAVDQSGNRSGPSRPATTRAP